MPSVNIPGVGTVNFPDGMSPEQIQSAIETDILPKAQPAEGTPSVSEAPIDMSDGIGDYAREAVGAFAKSAGEFGAYATEGATRAFVDGPGQLVTAAVQGGVDLYDKFRSPKVSELVTGKKPTDLPLFNLKRYNQAVETRRQAVREEFESTYNAPFPELATKISEVVTGFLGMGPLKVPAGPGIKESIKAGIKIGATTAPLTYIKEAEVNDKIGQSLLGTVFGTVIGGVTGLAGKAKDMFRNYLTDRPVAAQAQAAERLQGAFPSLEGNLSIGQRTGNVRTRQFESKSASREAQELWLKQAQGLRKDLEALANKYGPDMAPEEIVRKGGLALEGQIKKLTETRKVIYQADIGTIRAKLAADAGVPLSEGGKSLVRLPSLGAKVEEVLKSRGLKLESLSPEVRGYLESYGTNQGALQFDDLALLLTKLNDKKYSVLSAAGDAGQVASASSDLRKAVFNSLDEIAESSEVGTLLKQVRTKYGEQSSMISEIKKSTAARALGINPKTGFKEAVDNPEAALEKLLALTPSQQKNASALLKTGAPEVVEAMRGYNIRQAIEGARATGPQGAPSLDLDKLIGATVGNGKLRASGLYTEKDATVLRQNLDDLRALLSRAEYKAPTVTQEEGVMSGVGLLSGAGSLPFVARLLSRVSTGQGLEKILFNPQTQKDFLAIKSSFGSKSTQATRAASQAAARLEALLDGDMEEEE